MVKHPIHVKRSNYRGADPKKRAKASALNVTAAKLERHINELLLKQEDPIGQYLYYEIARDTGVPEGTVLDLCFCIDGGGNGFTVIRKDLDLTQALALMNGKGISLPSE